MKSILFYILFLSTSLFAQVDTDSGEIKEHRIKSAVVEANRAYWVSLPANYNEDLSYPVIYVLDAEWRFSITNAVEKELSNNGKIPPHIVVGIVHPNRRLDMSFSTSEIDCDGKKDTLAFTSQNSGNGDLFLKFLESELVPEVNQQYATSGFNILIGHSLGGYFCSYILPMQTSFNSLQIYDPSIWYSEGEVIRNLKTNLTQEDSCIVFLSSSENVDDQFAYHHQQIEELDLLLDGFPAIRHTYKNYVDENHNSMYLPSFIDGMAMLYEGYALKTGGNNANITLEEVEEHFYQFSRTVHHEFKPPIQVYLEIAGIRFHQKKYLECIETLKVYLDKNAKNAYAFELAGDAYFYLDKKEQSRAHYAKAYKLSRKNIRLKKKLKKM